MCRAVHHKGLFSREDGQNLELAYLRSTAEDSQQAPLTLMQGELRWADFMRCWAWEPYKLAMKLRRALITAAGRDDQPLPRQRLIDRDGGSKTAIEVAAEAALCGEACAGSPPPHRTSR